MTEERSFDELAGEEGATGTLSRGRAIKLMGAALLGGGLGAFTLAGEAQARNKSHAKPLRSTPIGWGSGATQIGQSNVPPNGVQLARYDFTGFFVSGDLLITEVSIRLTISDGNTAPGEADFNQLFLALNGINTGLALNGFISDATVTRLISGPPQDPATLGANLRGLAGSFNRRPGRRFFPSSPFVVASIIDQDPDDENAIGIPPVTTTITISGVETPSRRRKTVGGRRKKGGR
jgi:hypothetical protein